jgi:hypothetical protein
MVLDDVIPLWVNIFGCPFRLPQMPEKEVNHMATKVSDRARDGRSGLWSTITAAVLAGWAATLRLIAVLASLGILYLVIHRMG